jgi:hypothetical protein
MVGTVVSNPSWTQATWFIDPSGSLGTSSDSADGLTSGSALRTWAQLVSRWGTYSPRLKQDTTITFVSDHTDDTDPVYFAPFVEAQAQLILQGTLGSLQQLTASTLGAVVPKNRPAGQLLNAVLPSGSAGTFLTKTTTVQAGAAAASITTVVANNALGTYQTATVTGLSGMTAASVGHSLTLTGAASAGNNGTWYVLSFLGAGSVTVEIPKGGVANDANNGAITWVEKDLSRAWVYKNVSGTNWAISQPFTSWLVSPLGLGPINVTPPEVDTWAAADTYTSYSPVKVNLVRFYPVMESVNAAIKNAPQVWNLSVAGFGNSAGNDSFYLGGSGATFYECQFLKRLVWEASNQLVPTEAVVNCDIAGRVEVTVASSGPLGVIGGQVRSPGFFGGCTGLRIDGDIILGGAGSTFALTNYGTQCLDSNTILLPFSGLINPFASYNGGVPVWWGTGNLNTRNNTRVPYPAGAGKAVLTFPFTGSLQLNSQATAWLVTPTSSSMGRTINPTNLDADLGVTLGAYWLPGGSSITNAGL